MADESTVDYRSYQDGYRQAVCDLIPVPTRVSEDATVIPVIVAYLLGAFLTFLYFKFGRMT